ncbi:cytoplasmic polyadenylation element-binding protein 3 isoform X4, partial [Clarias magur]
MGDYGFALQSALLSSSGSYNALPLASFAPSKHRSSPTNVVYDILNNNSSLFLPLAAQQTMQDDLLMDKSKAQPPHHHHHQQQQQQQQEDPTSIESPSTPTPSPSEPAISEDSSPSSSSSSSSSQAPSIQSSQEKVAMESPILPNLGFPETGGNSLSPSFASTWSSGTANAVDDSFFQGIPPVNGTMLFQNFPHHVNPVFGGGGGGGFSPQIGLAQSQQQQQVQQQQQRRSPVSPNQAAFPQRNAYSHQNVVNTKASPSSSSSSSSAWSAQHSAVWSSGSNPWSGLPAGRDPRRAVGVGVGVGLPSGLNPISPMKKPYPTNVIAPPKFPRAAPLNPKPWLEDNAFRTDNGNNMLPFQ